MAKTDRTIFSATDQPPSGRGAAALSKGVRRGPHPFGLHLGNMICASAGKPAQLAAALAGVEAWRGHAFHRPDHQMPIRLTMGTMNIRDYGGDGPPVLLVPSLVNPAYILDLLPQNSLIGALRAQGLSPLLLDWGQPGEEERHFGLAHYVDRISQSITALAEVFGRPISVVGYCMGGTLSLAASLMDSSHISRLAVLAAPWDFHAHAARHRSLAAMALSLVPVIERLGYAPVDLVQSFFTGLNPSASLSKFTRFSRLDPQSAEAELFVALEDWANNGPPLAGPVAIEVLRDWYALNMPGQGGWLLKDRLVQPKACRLPVFAAVPKQDVIVPPPSALGLAGGLTCDALIRPGSGHVGMVVGRRARVDLWDPLARWLLAQ